jgi:hypothetical protein
MVAPRPLSWTERDVIVRTGSTYDRYDARWQSTRAVVGERQWSDPIGADPVLVAAVRATVDGERFLRWARFPYFVRDPGGETAFVGDLRYSSGTTESWAGIRVRIATRAASDVKATAGAPAPSASASGGSASGAPASAAPAR